MAACGFAKNCDVAWVTAKLGNIVLHKTQRRNGVEGAKITRIIHCGGGARSQRWMAKPAE